MTNNDLNQISKLLDEKLTTTEKRLKTEIANTEKNLRSEITTAITESEGNIIEEIAGFMEMHILPKLKEQADKSAIDRCERRIDHLADKVGEHDVRLKDVESIPVIAHQLKIKKAK